MFVMATWWYANFVPHLTPTGNTNFVWGLVHGVLLLPNFVWSWFNDNATIYQTPNHRMYYNSGFILGVTVVYGGILKLVLGFLKS